MKNAIKLSVMAGIPAFLVGYYSKDLQKCAKKYYALCVVTSRMMKDYVNGTITEEAMKTPEIRSQLIAFYVADYFKK